MYEAFFILIAPHASLKQFTQIRHARPIYKKMVRVSGDNDAHIQPGKRGNAQGFKDTVIRHEVRRCQVHMIDSFVYHLEIAVAYVFPLRIRPAGNDLCFDALKLLFFGEIMLFQRNAAFFGGKVPVHDKTYLHLVECVALYAQMRVPPWAIAFGNAEIFVADIKAADIACLAVYNAELAVVAVIQADNEAGQECCGMPAGGVKFIKEMFRQAGIADSVIQQAHFHAFRRFLRKLLHKARAKLVPAPDIVFQMDKLSCPADILYQCMKFFLSAAEIPDAVIEGHPVSGI